MFFFLLLLVLNNGDNNSSDNNNNKLLFLLLNIWGISLEIFYLFSIYNYFEKYMLIFLFCK